MATTVKMPQLGETVTEGTVTRWMKAVGERLAEQETLADISTDKVDTELPSPAAGILLKILVAEGQTVPVGTELALIGESADELSAVDGPDTGGTGGATAAAGLPGTASKAAVVPTNGNGRTDAVGRALSPVVRRLIAQHGLDVSQIPGSGAAGRVTRKDVDVFLTQRAETETETAAATPMPAMPTTASSPVTAEAPVTPPAPLAARVDAPAPAASARVATGPAPGDERRELSRLRARIAENMIYAKQTAAHVWTSVEVDYHNVEQVRQRARASFAAANGFSLTYLPFVARATAAALRDFPVVNSELDIDRKQAVFHRAVNLGIAIDINQGGLMVGNVRDADGLRVTSLARRIRTLADDARTGRLGPDDVTGATFTISNPGPYGSFMTAPIINVPNTAILSTDSVTKRVTVLDGPDGEDVIAIRPIGYLGLTWDHRAFDGSTALLFLRRIKQYLESWDWEQELA